MKHAVAVMILFVGTLAFAQASAPNGIAINGGTVTGNPTVTNNSNASRPIEIQPKNNDVNVYDQPQIKSAIQEKAEFDKQVADAKAAEAAEQKKKDDAIKNLDNKNPQPIAGECSLWDEKHKHCEVFTETLVSAMFSEAMQSQMTLRQAQQQAAAFLANPQVDAAAKTKVLLDLIRELQKSNHAQGCDITPPKIVDKKQVGMQWDCSNAAANVAAEAKQK